MHEFKKRDLLGCKDKNVVEYNGKYKVLKNGNLTFPALIHLNVVGDWDRISIIKGNIIYSRNLLTTDIIIGSFNFVNLGYTIGYDPVIESFNLINPSVNISGGAINLNEILIGTESQIPQKKWITDIVFIGASTVVTKNILEIGI